MSLFEGPHGGDESVEVDDPKALLKELKEAENTDGCDNSMLIETSQVRKALRESTSTNQRTQEKITEKGFIRRIELLLQKPLTPHLKFGLGILAVITDTNPGKLIEAELDELDGPQAIISVLCHYVTEHHEELLSQFQGKDTQYTLLKADHSQFTKHKTHQHADPELLSIMYITQLAHIAFHITYYDYLPVETLSMSTWDGPKSAIIMTLQGSVITVSHAGEESDLLAVM